MIAARVALDPARQALVARLQRQVERIEGLRLAEDERLISTGAVPLDRLLPGGGLRRGSLVEYLSPGPGSGTGTLALAAAREAVGDSRALVVVDCSRKFYPPAAAAWGIDLSQTLVLQPADHAAELWALDQALRCPGVGAVYAACGALDVRDFRRLQLAAESGGTLGVLVRPSRLRGQPSWADVQWQVRTKDEGRRTKEVIGHLSLVIRHSAWRLRVELVRCRGGPGGQVVELSLNETTGVWQDARTTHATHPVPLPAQLADPARPRRA
jgi:protein ImuA